MEFPLQVIKSSSCSGCAIFVICIPARVFVSSSHSPATAIPSKAIFVFLSPWLFDFTLFFHYTIIGGEGEKGVLS